ncbi:MAG: hypothetical protein KAJ86_01610 [Alphaproteobacteria bacterium]|nr:hypothetical protein [Alphaproteobacteria bacterium]
MTMIAGASNYLNAATVANKHNIAVMSTSVLGSGTATSLLEAGRRIAGNNGIGMSSRARELTMKFLNRTSEINAMFSLGVGIDATVDGMQKQILALRARFSDNQLAPSLRGDVVDEEA